MTQSETGPVAPSAPSQQEVPLGRRILHGIGLEPLVELLETSAYGVCITGEDHTWLYLNPAGERIIGQPLSDLIGRDYLLNFAEHERAAMLALESDQREGDTDFYTNTIVRTDGSEAQMTWSGTVIEIDGVEVAPAIFHESTPARLANRTAAEVAAAAQSTGGGDKVAVLRALLAEAVRSSRVTAGLVLLQDPGSLRVAVHDGLTDAVGQQVSGDGMLADLPGGPELLRGRSIYLSDGRKRYRENPTTRGWTGVLGGTWAGAAQFPLWRNGEVAGCLILLLAPTITSPSNSELIFWSSLADQASIVLGTEAVRREATESSALSERNRIARDLHDSVSQGLFSLQAHAQAVQRALAIGDAALATEAAQQLESLARQATTEMRALMTDLRHDPTVAHDLTEEVRDLVDRVSRRDGLDVQLTISPVSLPAVASATGEHVCRILGEALHNVAKHARTTTAKVTVSADAGVLTVRVEDHGAGFDSSTDNAGFGRHTMHERAALCGGTLTLLSAPGNGTTVDLTVPL